MKVVSYLSSLPPKMLGSEYVNNHKVLTLKNFAQGVRVNGDQSSVSVDMKYEPADVAVILGWVHEQGKTAPHLQFRREIIEQQKQHGKHTVIADSNLFLYSNLDNPNNYQRYSFDGIFPNTGIYCDKNPDPLQWKRIRNRTRIDIKDYRDTGSHILLCLQRNGGWSMGNISVDEWVKSTVIQLRQHTNRPIVLRGHPGDKHASDYIKPLINIAPNLQISLPGTPLLQDLKNCWAVVNHNSSSVVGAAIEGYPIFVTDPVRSQCYDIANTDLETIESPILYNRQPWIERISMFHWNFQELSNGACWKHMRQYI